MERVLESACQKGMCRGVGSCITEITCVLQFRGEAISPRCGTKAHGAIACDLLMIVLTLAPGRISVYGTGGTQRSSDISYKGEKKILICHFK